jgi:hypothetical protein
MAGCSAHYTALLPSGARPRTLSAKELAVLCVFCSRVVGDAAGTVSSETTQVALRIERELEFHHQKMVEDIKASLLLVEHGGLIHGSFTRFTRQDEAAQHQRLLDMTSSSVELERAAFAALRLMAVFFHYTDEKTWPGIGYAGPLVPVPSPPPADNRRI